MSLLGISLFSGMQRGVHKNGLLFTERVFGWTVVDYTDYRSFECTIYAIRYVCILASKHNRIKLNTWQIFMAEFFTILLYLKDFCNNSNFMPTTTHARLYVSNHWRSINRSSRYYNSKYLLI